MMDTHLQHLTYAFKGVKFAKFNCGEHEEFSTAQRIRSLPTFRCGAQARGAPGLPASGISPSRALTAPTRGSMRGLTPASQPARPPARRLYHKRKCLEQVTGAQPVKVRVRVRARTPAWA